MCFAFKDTIAGRVHKGVDDARTKMWSKLGFDAIRDPIGEKMGVSSKHTNVDSTKGAKPTSFEKTFVNAGLQLK
jgi:hypothetical protein